MARLAIIFFVCFSLFIFSSAHFQVHSSTENDVDSSKSMPNIDSNPTALPANDKSDQSGGESALVVEATEAVDVNDLVNDMIPETTRFVSFHPINRHSRLNRQFAFRRPNRYFVRPMNHRSQEISYGNDMILSNSNNGRDSELLLGDQVIPSMALKFQRENHHHRNHHHRRHHQNEFMLKRPLYREDDEGEKVKENGGFVKRFRKFLNHF